MKICPICNHDQLYKKGKTESGKQRYKCKSCGHRTVNPLEARANTPDGYAVKGQSVLYDEAGNVKLTWEKVDRNKEQQLALMKEAIKEMANDVKRASPLRLVPDGNEELLTLYTFTDYHLGMLAWHQEGGDDWDLNIAESLLIGAFQYMIEASPNSATCIINNLGDFLHFDGLLPVTPTSGHVLDADSRYKKVVRVAIRIIRALVKIALEKHERLILINAQGNHDLSSAVWLQELFSSHYETEPRVFVDTSALPFYCHQHGLTMLAFHHSHKVKFEQIGAKIPAEFPEVWGATRFRYVHTGHYHHKRVKEDNGIITEQHQTLAARDSHASYGGYHSERATTAIVYSAKHGEVSRINVKPEMLKGDAA